MAIRSPDPGTDGRLELIAVVLVPRVKITVPSLPSEFVARAELCADLDAGAAAEVALVCAPAGYGKTLLLADWSRTSTAWTPRGWAWTATTTTRGGCGRRSWPRSPAARRCRIQPAARPWAWRRRPAGVHRRVRRRRAGAAAADPADPRRRARTGRPGRPARRPDLHPDQARDRPARAVQPARSTAVASPVASAGPAVGAARRAAGLHPAPGGGAAGEVGAATVAAAGRGAAPAYRRLGRRPAAGRPRLGESADREAFLTQFSGDDRSVADYLVGEILSGLPEDVQEFLRVISICDPVPVGLAAELSGREDAGSVLDRLEHQTSLVTATGPAARGLPRPGAPAHASGRRPAAPGPATGGRAARRGRPLVGRPGPAGTRPRARRAQPRRALLTELLHRFAVRLILAGRPRAAAARDGQRRCPGHGGRSLAVPGLRTHPSRGRGVPAAQGDLRHARQFWPAHARRTWISRCCVPSSSSWVPTRHDRAADPAPSRSRNRRAARRTGAGGAGPSGPGRRPSRARRPGGARAEFDAALALSRRHGFDYLTMQCLALLGVVAGISGSCARCAR